MARIPQARTRAIVQGNPYPRSACTAAGSRSPAASGIARISHSSGPTGCSSRRLAGPTRTASGVPSASVARCRFRPRSARSVGFGPVCAPLYGPGGGRVEDRSFEVQQPPLAEGGEQLGMGLVPDSGGGPLGEPRQQVLPEPQPISAGSDCQRSPSRRTNRMPAKAARSPTRGRPPLGAGGWGGRCGAIASQSSSVTRAGMVRGLQEEPIPYPDRGY